MDEDGIAEMKIMTLSCLRSNSWLVRLNRAAKKDEMNGILLIWSRRGGTGPNTERYLFAFSLFLSNGWMESARWWYTIRLRLPLWAWALAGAHFPMDYFSDLGVISVGLEFFPNPPRCP